MLCRQLSSFRGYACLPLLRGENYVLVGVGGTWVNRVSLKCAE